MRGLLYLLSWWYGQGWGRVLKSAQKRLHAINQTFSVLILLRTLFAPWKQIQSPKSFRNFFQSSLDNFISRCIGATVRLGMLLIAAIATLLVGLAGLTAFLLWPLLPLLIIGLPVAAITRIGL